MAPIYNLILKNVNYRKVDLMKFHRIKEGVFLNVNLE